MKKFSKLFIASLIIGGILSLTACGNGGGATTGGETETGGKEVVSKIEQIKKSGKLILGTSADYPPYEFHKEIDGKDTIVGFDIEIAKEIAKDLGVELEIKDMDFDGLLLALNADKVDMVMAGMTPDPERIKVVDFSKIYYEAVHGVVINVANKDTFKTVEDLAGKKVGAQKGAVQEDIAVNELHVNRICRQVMADNERSKHSIESSGYHLDGVDRQANKMEDGTYMDHLWYSKLASEYKD